MRDPRGPIPHPQLESHYWRTVRPPRPRAEARGSDDASEIAYDPTQLLPPHDRSEDLGIDRRQVVRAELEAIESIEAEIDETTFDLVDEVDGAPREPVHRLDHARRSACVLTGAHRRFDALLGLRSAAGWALVRTISLSPNGVLLRVVDPCDPGLDRPLRLRARAALARLGQSFADVDGPPDPTAAFDQPGSMLATVGTCLLSRRVVADVSRWSHSAAHKAAQRTSSVVNHRPHLEVELVVPPALPQGGRRHMRVSVGADALSTGRAAAPRFTGRVVPLNDPSDLVLAVALEPAQRARLEAGLRGLGPRRGPDEMHADVDGVLAP